MFIGNPLDEKSMHIASRLSDSPVTTTASPLMLQRTLSEPCGMKDTLLKTVHGKVLTMQRRLNLAEWSVLFVILTPRGSACP